MSLSVSARIRPSPSRKAYLEEYTRLHGEVVGMLMCIPFGKDGSTASHQTIAQSFPKLSLDHKLGTLGAYFDNVSQGGLDKMHQSALVSMAERGLLRLLAKILVEFVKWDRRECRKTVKNRAGWTLPVTVLHSLYSCVKTHIHSAPSLDNVLSEWPMYAPYVFEAIIDSQKIWHFFSGLKIGSVLEAGLTLDSLGLGANMLIEADLPAVTPTPRSIGTAARLMAKIRQCVVIQDSSMQEAQAGILYNSGPFMFLALRSLSEDVQGFQSQEPKGLDIPGLTGLSYRDFLQQIITIACRETSSLDMSSEFALLHYVLRPRNASKDLAEAVEQLSVLSRLIPLFHALLSMPRPEKELFRFVREKEDIVDVSTYLLSFFNLILSMGIKYHLPNLVNHFVLSDALFLAERVMRNSTSTLNYEKALRWVHDINLIVRPNRLHDLAVKKLRVIAARSRYVGDARVTSSEHPEEVRCRSNAIRDDPSATIPDASISCEVEVAQSPSSSAAAQSSDSSLGGSRPEPPSLTDWEKLYLRCYAPDLDASGVLITIPTLLPANVCAAAGCASLEPPTNKCGHCKARYYCGPECQRSDWKAHKVQCRPE